MSNKIQLLLCLVAGLLVQEAVSIASNEAALNKLENYLQEQVANNDLDANRLSVATYLHDTSINRKSADILLDPAVLSAFFHFSILVSPSSASFCDAAVGQSLEVLNEMMGGKACQPSLDGGSRVERIVHEVCRQRGLAAWCRSRWINDYVTSSRQYGGTHRTVSSLKVFLQDSDSNEPSEMKTKAKLVEANLNGPDAGRLLAMAMYESVETISKKIDSMRNIDQRLGSDFQEYIVMPCESFMEKVVKNNYQALTSLQALKPDEMPGDDKFKRFYDGLLISKVCKTVIEKQSEYKAKMLAAMKA